MVGWKDILRPIRDGLRDQLPSRKPKEDDDEAEKRRRQRKADVLKGFAYFESFEEIESWSAQEVDPLQRANTPLLTRPQSRQDEPAKARVVLIHDYAGNYHDYEACQGSFVTKESYACEYMQFVDSFVYFSHKVSQCILILRGSKLRECWSSWYAYLLRPGRTHYTAMAQDVLELSW